MLLGNSGGPENGGETIVLYLYNQAFVKNQFGYGSAVAWALFLLIVLFSVINWRLLAGNDNPVGRQGRRRRG